MSMDTCHHCGDPVDTDADTDCYVFIEAERPGQRDQTICVCGGCQEAFAEAQLERAL